MSLLKDRGNDAIRSRKTAVRLYAGSEPHIGPLYQKYALEEGIALLRHIFNTSKSLQEQRGAEASKSTWTMSDQSLTSASFNEMTDEVTSVLAKYRLLAQRERKLFAEDELIPVAWAFAASGPYERDPIGPIINI